MESYWPQPSTDGYCQWCGEPLSAADVFTHELETAGWEQDGGLLAPEHPALARPDEPIASCRSCRDGMIANFENRLEDEAEERRSAVIASAIWRLYAGVLLLLGASYLVYVFVRWIRS